jgi:hypothetical protein
MYNALPLNLLRFCIEHSDDPTTITNLDPARFDRDPEDYKWLMAALGDLETDSTKALRILEKLKANNMSDDDLAAGLEALQYLVEDIDVAKSMLVSFSQSLTVLDVAKQSGIPVIVSLLPHNSPPVRSWSAWILASLSQNNHAIFEEGTMLEVVNLLISLLPKEEDSEALSKQLYVLSSFLSNDSHLTNTFLDNSGLQLVVPWMLHEYAPIRVCYSFEANLIFVEQSSLVVGEVGARI